MASTGIAAATKVCYASSKHHRLNPTKKVVGSIKFLSYTPNHSSSSSLQRSLPIQATNTDNSQKDDPVPDDTPLSQEDLNYLLKLGAGSVVGAAVIKYGSILFPAITRPNILQALAMITTPVIVAVFLLIKQSRTEQRS